MGPHYQVKSYKYAYASYVKNIVVYKLGCVLRVDGYWILYPYIYTIVGMLFHNACERSIVES